MVCGWFCLLRSLKTDTTITVNDAKYGELINAKADIEINPILGYAGIGYRF